jgi:hypothetical protein
MNEFRIRNPDLFYKLYPIEPDYRDLSTMEWYDHLPNNIISHPYDPLTIVLANEDADPLHSNGISVFSRILIGNVVRSFSRHQSVGNENIGDRGVPDSSAVKLYLFERMVRGILRRESFPVVMSDNEYI